ncbi:hypothetical protein RvY_18172 [Ramazzottius varieornatus]|uniref:Carboxylesterase type B domain-containing protein n=1 Tax=Ramazzottius varieornatus TaxID=947166 RepID=A0A1D1W4S2_RAMVA|nr:hypothetical protein RvY_18172 [Ramazzottius varieornatus]
MNFSVSICRMFLSLWCCISMGIKMAIGFNYMDYANLYDGVAHVNRLKIMGKSTWTSHDSVWRAWEFSGIRYATADRFQPPKFFDDYTHDGQEQLARVFAKAGSACIQASQRQYPPPLNMNLTSEDCLFLNIHVPPVNQEHSLLKNQLRPVLVFIHGGDFQAGAGHLYDANSLARAIDAVVVTVNYRLGLFGFLSVEDASARGNWGMKDMVMALKWIRQYIGRFGADAHRMTLLGHGSGASMVSLAMMDRDVREIIAGVILMGGSSFHHKSLISSAQTYAVALGRSAGCPDNGSLEALMGCLRNKEAVQLLLADAAMSKTKTTDMPPWRPSIDSDSVPYNPHWIFRSSEWKFNGSVLQGYSMVPISGLFDYLNDSGGAKISTAAHGKSANDLSPLDEGKQYQVALDEAVSNLHPFVSEALGCTVTDEVAEQVLQHYLDVDHAKRTRAAIHKAIQKIAVDINQRLAVLQEAVEYVKNPSLLQGKAAYQMYALDSATECTRLNWSLGRPHEMYDVAYLFGGRLGEILLGPDGDEKITAQMRYLVAAFVKNGRGFGVPFDLEYGHMFRLNKQKEWQILPDHSVADVAHFWEDLKAAACEAPA